MKLLLNSSSKAIAVAVVIACSDQGFAKDFADNEVIVKFKSGKQAYAAVASAACGATKSEDIGDGQTKRLVLSGKNDVEDVVAMLKNAEEVEFAEPNYKRYLPRKASSGSTDKTQQKKEVNILSTDIMGKEGNGDRYQWNLKTMHVQRAKTLLGKQKGVVVAVLDTGVDTKHKALHSQILPGYDAITDSAEVNCYTDREGHGTHCAGIIAAQKIHKNAISGIASDCYIYPVRVIEQSEGYVSWSATGIRKAVDAGAKIITMSYGSSTYSEAEKEAIEYAYSKGVTLFASAGNYGKKNHVSYPAFHKNVVSVGATNELDMKTNFSNYGNFVNIYAPGKKIISTVPDNAYALLDGTSMACPSVAAVAALVLSVKPDLRPAQVWGVLEDTADKINDPNAGLILRVNALKAVEKVIKRFFPNRIPEANEILIAERNPSSHETKMTKSTGDLARGILCQSHLNSEGIQCAELHAKFPFKRVNDVQQSLAIQLELVADVELKGSLASYNLKSNQYDSLSSFTTLDTQKKHCIEISCNLSDDYFDKDGNIVISLVATATVPKKNFFWYSKEKDHFNLQVESLKIINLNSSFDL